MPRIPAIEYVQRDAPALFGRVVRVLLDGVMGRAASGTPVVVDASDWGEVWGALCHHRIETFLPAALAEGVVVIPDAVVDDVRNRARQSAAQQMKLGAAVSDTVERLGEVGIEVRVLKGLATSVLDYPDPTQRRTSDVDVFVSTQDFERACEIVEASGASILDNHRRSVQPVERTFLTSGGVEIDIHCRLFRFGPDHAARLLRDPVPLPSGSGLAMPPEARLVHAAAHLLVSPPGHRLASSLFDVAVLGSSPKVDLGQSLQLADVFGVRDIVRFAIWLADSVGAGSVEPPPRADKTLINRAHLRTNRRIDLETLAVLVDLDGFRNRLGHVVHQARGGPKETVARRVGRR